MTHNDYKHSVAERLMRYVQIDTQSDPESETQPSTAKQKNLSRILVEELQALGIKDAELDENGYVYATVPSNVDKPTPVVCFCSHVDTSPDCSGFEVKPLLHKKWDGADMVLPDDTSVVISKDNHPYLEKKIGEDIITASGKTLLGADDKAGVAVIMDAVQYWMSHPEAKHGDIRILFTPDEEIGRGVDAVNMEKLSADFGYTMDGGECPDLEGETFSADAVTVKIYGKSAHTGYAKGKLVNAIKVAATFVDSLPRGEWAPEDTNGREGFVHPLSITGKGEEATVQFLIRSFVTKELEDYENRLRELVEKAVAQFPGASFDFQVHEQYRNMKEVLDQHPKVMEIAAEAYRRSGLDPVFKSIRGGTDGARLSFMGLPCPNIFTGEMGIHSKQEYCSVQDMERAVEIAVNIATVTAE